MVPLILVVTKFPDTLCFLEKELRDIGEVRHVKHFNSAFEFLYREDLRLVIVDMTEGEYITPLLNSFKGDPLFASVPILAIWDESQNLPDWNNTYVDDYIWCQSIERDFKKRAQLVVARANRVVEINPLTRLPGNIAINLQIQNRIDGYQSFSLCYADLDHFKPFNDKYGFSRGDEILKIASRLILNIVRSNCAKDGFVGHIGGDDFIFITDIASSEGVCRDIITAFDDIIPTFYDFHDRENGYIESQNRDGIVQKFPFLSVTMGVVHVKEHTFTHYGEVTQIASEMKSFGKKKVGSCYNINRRSIGGRPDAVVKEQGTIQ